MMNQQLNLLSKDTNFIKFRFAKPLSIHIKGTTAIKWRNSSLDLSKSKQLVNIAQLLHQWYKNANMSAALNFEITYLPQYVRSFDVRKENWIKLIVKVIKKLFTVNRSVIDDKYDVFPFEQYDELQNSVYVNQRMKITLFKPRMDDKDLCIVLSVCIDCQ